MVSTSQDVRVRGKFAELPKRIVSAAILVALVAGVLWFSHVESAPQYFAVLVSVAAVVMFREWVLIVSRFRFRILWVLAGCLYIGLSSAALASLAFIEVAENASLGSFFPIIQVVFVIVVVAATDIGAYFAGKIIGGAKIAPRVSPNKTWAGLAGGIGAAVAASYVMQPYVAYPDGVPNAVRIAILMAIVAQSGDFFESWLKRRANIKDSGKIIPGHGGLLDRFDGIMPVAILYYVFLMKFSGAIG